MRPGYPPPATVLKRGMPIKASEYVLCLYARRDEAVEYTRETIAGPNGWSPAEHNCHDNVKAIAEMDSRYSPVNGWLVCDYGDEVAFIAHSILHDNDGRFIDITPPDGRPIRQYPFLIDDDEGYWPMANYSKTLYPLLLKCPAHDRSPKEIRRMVDETHAETHRHLFGGGTDGDGES